MDEMDPKAVFQEIASIVSHETGVQLGVRQEAMIRSRLTKRFVELEILSPTQYLDYLKSHRSTEVQTLISLLTTHHTYFFREFIHFEVLESKVLPAIIPQIRKSGRKTLRVWCAACSRGQEVYSLAMFLRQVLSRMAPDFTFEILGTDVDEDSVAIAQNGVYRWEELKEVPSQLLSSNWTRGTGEISEFAKCKDVLRKLCKFEVQNLMKVKESSVSHQDIIFCRNVFIYFSPTDIEKITANLTSRLEPWGHFFVGLSESLNVKGSALQSIAPSVYSKQPPPVQATVSTQPVAESKIRVICVDDSSAIHMLLKKLLTPEAGFEIVACPTNGLEAAEAAKTIPFDVMTLDIEMPKLGGLDYLRNYFKPGHPPVVMMSSLNRDADYAGKEAMQLGASDYIEKPSMQNIKDSKDQLISKIKMVVRNDQSKKKEPPREKNPLGLVTTAEQKKVRVLIVDDSPTVTKILSQTISRDPGFEVVGVAHKPSEVEGLIEKHRPNVMTLDIVMPEMDGVSLLKKLFPKFRIPTVMISSINREESPLVLDALESGAVDYIQKPTLSDLASSSQILLEKLKTASSAKLQNRSIISRTLRHHSGPKVRLLTESLSGDQSRVIAIGSSTGGTEALREVFAGFPNEIPPVLVVQHIPPVFSKAFADRMNQMFAFEVKEAEDGDLVVANRVLIAPGGRHMEVRYVGSDLKVVIHDQAPVNRHKPSVDVLFNSVSKVLGKKAVGAILTGMGNDGAKGLLAMKLAGSETLAQDEASCIVYGMPREAVRMNAAMAVKPLGQVAPTLLSWARTRKAA